VVAAVDEPRIRTKAELPVESRIRSKGSFASSRFILSKPNPYPKWLFTPAQKLRKNSNLGHPFGRFDGPGHVSTHPPSCVYTHPPSCVYHTCGGLSVFYPGGDGNAVWPQCSGCVLCARWAVLTAVLGGGGVPCGGKLIFINPTLLCLYRQGHAGYRHCRRRSRRAPDSDQSEG